MPACCARIERLSTVTDPRCTPSRAPTRTTDLPHGRQRHRPRRHRGARKIPSHAGQRRSAWPPPSKRDCRPATKPTCSDRRRADEGVGSLRSTAGRSRRTSTSATRSRAGARCPTRSCTTSCRYRRRRRRGVAASDDVVRRSRPPLRDAGRMRLAEKIFEFVPGRHGRRRGGGGGGGGGAAAGTRRLRSATQTLRVRELGFSGGDLQLYLGAAGIRFNPWRTLLVTANLLFPMTKAACATA